MGRRAYGTASAYTNCQFRYYDYYDGKTGKSLWKRRRLGLRAGKLVDAGAAQMSFFANTRDLEREERLEIAVDALRERFGGGSVRRGTVLEKKEREGE